MPRFGCWRAAAFLVAALAGWPQPTAAQFEPGNSSRAQFRLLDDLRGRVVLLDFWATWCAPCLVEIPRLRRLHGELEQEGLTIVGVSLDVTDARSFASWTRRQGVTWPQVRDGRGYSGELPRLFGIDALPSTILFDRQGRIAARDLRGAALERAIRGLLAREHHRINNSPHQQISLAGVGRD